MAVISSSPMFMTGHTYNAEELRAAVAAIGDAGVSGASDLAVTQRGAGANMSVDVAVGSCIIPGLTRGYLCHNPSTVNLAIAAAPGVGNERIDLVYAQIQDNDITPGSSQWKIDVVTGTPSGSPSAPSLPSVYSIPLAQVRLTSATTSITNAIITNARYQSAPPMLQAWPLTGQLDLTSQTVAAVSAEWGAITIPAPNRKVRVISTVDGSAVCDTGDANCYMELAIRVEVGGSGTTSGGTRALSVNALSPVSISRSDRRIITPGVGEDIVVSVRIVTTSGGDGVFDRGRFAVEVWPAP